MYRLQIKSIQNSLKDMNLVLRCAPHVSTKNEFRNICTNSLTNLIIVKNKQTIVLKNRKPS